MTLREMSDTSIAISLYRRYEKFAQGLGYLYQNSQTCNLAQRSWRKTKDCFRYSFLGRITEIKQMPPVILDNSRTVQYLISFCKRWKSKIVHYSKTSLANELAKDTKEELNFSPAKITSEIIIAVLVFNVFLFFVFQKQIGQWGWLLRGLFLLVALAGLSCEADWQTIKQSSIFLRRLQ